MQVSRIIRKYGYDLSTVASMAEIPLSSLSKTVNNKNNPTIEKLRKIADVIGCDITEFFEDEIKHQKMPSDPSRTDKIRKMMDEKGLSVTDVAESIGKSSQSLYRTMRTDSYNKSTLKALAEVLECDVNELSSKPNEHTLFCPHCGKEFNIE